MNNIFKYTWGAVLTLALATTTACSPDTFDSVSEAGVPSVDNVQVRIDIDPETNQVTFNMDGAQIYPVWMLESGSSTVYSTQNGMQKIFSAAGEYSINYRVGNRNGISLGTGTATFRIENSLVDYDRYKTLLCGKSWKIARSEAGHIGCGPTGTAGTEWYSAAPNEKAAFGVYDDVVSFTTDGAYTYSPGEGGTVYVNKDCTAFPGYSGTEDYMVPVSEQTSTYEISGEGTDVYITLGANTLFPYISGNDQYATPKFRLESLTATKMVLIYDNGTTAWHFILSAGDEGFSGFDANSDCNLWKDCTYTNEFYYAPGWSQIADPTLTADGNSYTVTLPTATAEQWQAQVKFLTDISTFAAENYDFSAKFMSNKDHNNVTVKLVMTGDDNTFYFTENIKLKAYEEYVFYKSDMPGIDMANVSLVLDFGGNAEDTEVNISNIDLQEHKCDGIEAPAEEEDKTVYEYDSPANLWKAGVDDNNNFSTFFYYAPGWTEIAAPEFTGNKGVYIVKLPTATTDQWQAQVHIISDIAADADTPYDFACTLMPNKDLKQVTLKLTDTASDENYLFLQRVDFAAYTETMVKIPASVLPAGAATGLKLVMDFGGNPADTEVTISNIILQRTAL